MINCRQFPMPNAQFPKNFQGPISKPYSNWKLSMLPLITLLLLTFGCSNAKNNDGHKKITLTSHSKNYSFNVEIVDDPAERALGLMYREQLAKDAGMLFIFSGEEYQSFWMKNTKMPLDLLFFDSRGYLVDYKDDFLPCPDDDLCENYVSKGKAKYVLEVNNEVLEKGYYWLNSEEI